MLFNSFQFIWLFPIIFLAYYGINIIRRQSVQGKKSNVFLLLISYAVYMQWNLWYGLVLLWVTIVTYGGALGFSYTSHKKILVYLCTIGAFLPLFLFKYWNFGIENINALGGNIPCVHWAIPLGLSFYTFQAVGYLIDVYKQRFSPERDFLDYALFVAFFPQILSGPISKAAELLPQIKSIRKFDESKAVQGLKFLLWGMFLKVVIADRLGIYVDTVYNNYLYQSGISCFVASLLYSIQIYGDFAGYSLMAIGAGKVLGFDLVNNFERPYFATSITEFWKRWHISLTRWLTTYIYIGLGGNRCSKLRQCFNIMITFLVSGIWHGANWTFVIWGVLHGSLQCIEKMTGLDPKGRFASHTHNNIIKGVRLFVTFLAVNFAWILFRLPSVEIAGSVMKKIIYLEGGGLFLPNNSTMGYMAVALSIILIKEVCEEFYHKVQMFNNPNRYIRWGSYIAVCVLIMLCGVFDSGQFIYVQF